MKGVIAWWIILLILKDGGCSFTFVKVSDPNNIKAAAKSPCNTHPPICYTHWTFINDMKMIGRKPT